MIIQFLQPMHYSHWLHIQQPQTGQQPPTQPTAQPVAAAVPPAPKEQETTADQNADDDIFAKFEESPPPASNQVQGCTCCVCSY